MLGETEEPQALPKTGASQDKRTASALYLLLGLGGLALLSASGTLVAVRRKR